MKIKLGFTVIIALCITNYATAQYLGIKGGFNLSKLQIDDVEDERGRFGYHFGAYLFVPITESFGIQPEVLYSTKGSTAEYNLDIFGTPYDGEVTLELNYIDVPLMAVVRLGSMVELHGGPYIGFLTNAKYKSEGDLGSSDEDLDNDSFKNVDYGIGFGGAINLNALQFGARYNIGFQKVQDDEFADYLIGDAKNNYLQIFAAIRLGSYD